MTEVETFLWQVPRRGQRRGYVSAVHRTPEEAMKEYGPGATPVPGSLRQRPVLETQEEILRAQFNYQSAGMDAVKPPRK